MENSTIQCKLNDIKRFIPNDNDTLLSMFDRVADFVKEANQDNIEAVCPSRKFDTQEYDLCEENYIDDYEVVTGAYEFELDGEYYSVCEDEKERMLDERNDRLYELETQLEDTDENTSKYNTIQEQIDTVDAEIEAIKNAEFEYDEVMWNFTWNFDDFDPNAELAHRLGLAIVRRTSDDKEFIALTGCGMDLTPKIMAYQALEFGYIDEKYIHKLRDIGYVKYVMGDAVFKEVMNKLGIAHLEEITEEKAKERMAAFNKKMDALAKLRDSGADNLVVGLGAMMALNESR